MFYKLLPPSFGQIFIFIYWACLKWGILIILGHSLPLSLKTDQHMKCLSVAQSTKISQLETTHYRNTCIFVTFLACLYLRQFHLLGLELSAILLYTGNQPHLTPHYTYPFFSATGMGRCLLLQQEGRSQNRDRMELGLTILRWVWSWFGNNG